MMRLPLGGERGSVAAEFAIALPAIGLVLLLGCGSLATASRHVRLQDAAADAARLAARGEPLDRIVSVVVATAPDASVDLEHRGELICATVTAPAALPMSLVASSCALEGGA